MQPGVVLLLALGLLSYGACEVDFVDCGSRELFIDSVEISGCYQKPCVMFRSATYTVNIRADHLDPLVTSIDLDVRASVRGALFQLSASCDHPCVLDCPLQTKLIEPQIPINILINRFVLPGLTSITINANFNGQPGSKFCIKFDVDVY